MRAVQAFVLLTILIFLCPRTSFAQQEEKDIEYAHCGLCEFAEADHWLRSAPGKIFRGLTNVTLGWTNLFSRPAKAVTEGDNILIGIADGIGHTLARTAQGAVEVVVFWFPPVEDEPLRNCALGDLGWTGR
ncbi:MAG: hypothetical protein A3G87_01775 [Omnitrophica bacterium RIFCSPLOWO2_12_FULL_50_11]|nr:MAG: hypothetical protein A3G87_01775 [Omnitrophica bacterium RIFCSPLOWO2_12_FULL_50_11]